MINSIDIRKSLSQKRIDSFNRKRFLLPVLIADSIKKGIFLSVNDFINNMPVADSAYTFDKKGRLFKKGDKTTEIFYLLYANEKGLYFRPSKKAYIFRTGNAYEFFILNDVYLSKTTAGNLLGLIPDTKFPGVEVLERTEFHTGNAARLHYILVPRQINMETGELY